jgi:hypothetical protein
MTPFAEALFNDARALAYASVGDSLTVVRVTRCETCGQVIPDGQAVAGIDARTSHTHYYCETCSAPDDNYNYPDSIED